MPERTRNAIDTPSRRGADVPAVQSPAPASPASDDGPGIGQARNRCRRMPATLPKMRKPNTTTTPVDSCPPTPSWSPR